MNNVQFKEVLNLYANNSINQAVKLLTDFGSSPWDFAHYGMAMSDWSGNRFSLEAFKGVTGQPFTQNIHDKWKLSKNLFTFQELLSLHRQGNPEMVEIISKYFNEVYHTLDHDKQQQLLQNGIVNENDFFKNDLNKGIIPFNTFHLYNVDSQKKRIIDEYIGERYDSGKIVSEELEYYYKNGFLDRNRLSIYCSNWGIQSPIPTRKPSISVPSHLWVNPMVLENRTDIVLIGNVNAGKSMLLASFLSYCEQKNNLDINSTNKNGSLYSSLLLNIIKNGNFIEGTPPGEFLTIAADFKVKVRANWPFRNEDEKNAPVNLIELPGEAFQRTFISSDEKGIPENIRKTVYSKNHNPKIYVFTIPTDENEISISIKERQSDGFEVIRDIKVNAQNFYSYFLNYLIEAGLMTNIIGIALVFTKFDKYQLGDANHFMQNECQNLYTKIKGLVNSNPRIKAGYFPYTIGNVDEDLNTYESNPALIAEFYEWYISIIPTN